MAAIITCIGSGNMGSALMKGAAKNIKSENIFFTDEDKGKAASLAGEMGAGLCGGNVEAARNGGYVFLAVKPQVLEAVLSEIAPVVRERLIAGNPPVLVSMAPGWSIAKIQAAVKGIDSKGAPPSLPPVARIMPNTPALISRGLIAMAYSPELRPEAAAELEKILSASGLVDRLEEKYFDAITGLSGSGPAFVYLFIEAMADGGVKAGLARDKALRFAAQTVLGAAAMVLETGKHPGELKDMVTSPGGTTIAGVAALENGAFRGTVINAVEAAWRRAAELG